MIRHASENRSAWLLEYRDRNIDPSDQRSLFEVAMSRRDRRREFEEYGRTRVKYKITIFLDFFKQMIFFSNSLVTTNICCK